MLRAAAVMARDVEPQLLGRISGLSAWATLEALSELERRDLIVAGGFRHDLARRSIYADLPAERRRTLHLRIAEAEPSPAVAAEHWLKAGRPVQAAATWLDGATEFRDRGLAAQGVAVLRRGQGELAELAGLEPQRQRLEARLAALLEETGASDEAEALAGSLLERGDPLVKAEAAGGAGEAARRRRASPPDRSGGGRRRRGPRRRARTRLRGTPPRQIP